EYLEPLLTEHGFLVVLEDEQDGLSNLALYQKDNGNLQQRRNLGWIDFSRRLQQSIIDLGLADEQLIREASLEAKKLQKPLMQILSKKLNLDEHKLFSSLAKERQLLFKAFDELVNDIDASLFNQFS